VPTSLQVRDPSFLPRDERAPFGDVPLDFRQLSLLGHRQSSVDRVPHFAHDVVGKISDGPQPLTIVVHNIEG